MEYRVMNIRQATAEELQLWYSQMGQERQTYIRRLQREDDRLRSLCADHLARAMLSEALACPPETLIFCRTERGKPYLKDGALQFNLSHSGDFVACAIDRFPIGIDLEVLRPIRPELCQKVCTSRELDFVYRDGVFDSGRFLRLWTAKEALLKQQGRGILTDLTALSVWEEGHFLPTFFQSVTDEYVLTVACT